ncbi:hypothetical protein IWW55_002463, partial [Coemansia sp. RSA 2706]
ARLFLQTTMTTMSARTRTTRLSWRSPTAALTLTSCQPMMTTTRATLAARMSRSRLLAAVRAHTTYARQPSAGTMMKAMRARPRTPGGLPGRAGGRLSTTASVSATMKTKARRAPKMR